MGLAILMFVVGVGVVMGGYTLVARLPGYLEARRLNQRLADLSAPVTAEGEAVIVKRAASGPLPMLDKLVASDVLGSPMAVCASRHSLAYVMAMSAAFGSELRTKSAYST